MTVVKGFKPIWVDYHVKESLDVIYRHRRARRPHSSQQNSNNYFVQQQLETCDVSIDNVPLIEAGEVRRSPAPPGLCIRAVHQNNRVGKDQSKTEQRCGWMNMDKSGNSFAALVSVSEADVHQVISQRETRRNIPQQPISITVLTGIINKPWTFKPVEMLQLCSHPAETLLKTLVAFGCWRQQNVSVQKPCEFTSTSSPWKAFVLSHEKEYL